MNNFTFAKGKLTITIPAGKNANNAVSYGELQEFLDVYSNDSAKTSILSTNESGLDFEVARETALQQLVAHPDQYLQDRVNELGQIRNRIQNEVYATYDDLAAYNLPISMVQGIAMDKAKQKSAFEMVKLNAKFPLDSVSGAFKSAMAISGAKGAAQVNLVNQIAGAHP